MFLGSSWRIVFPMAMIGYVFDVSVGQGYLKKKKKAAVGGTNKINSQCFQISPTLIGS